MLTRRACGILTLTLGLAACGDEVGPNDPIEQALDEDIAMVAADAAVEDMQQLVFGGGAPAIEGGAPLEISRTVTFVDAEGNEQLEFDPMTTDTVRIAVEMSGEVERDSWTATISRMRDLAVSGLAGEETSRTWNGTGSGSVTGSRHTDGTDTRTYAMESSSVIDAVVVGIPRSENPWPLSGTITRTFTVTFTRGDQTETRTRTAVLTFNGTQFATLTIGDEVFEVDLDARDGDRPHRRRDR